MPTYNKSTVELLRQYIGEHPDQNRFTSDEIVNWFRRNWPNIKVGTVRAHLVRMSVNAPSRIHLNVKPGVHDLLFQLRPGEYRRYQPANDPPPIYTRDDTASARKLDGREGGEPPLKSPEEQPGSGAFAYEAHLRDYLAHNLHVLEPGLRLYEDEGIRGVEYPIRNRRIDLLAEAQDNSLVVIELKVSQGHERTVGQILTYMGWVRQDIAEGRPVRGMIVANALSDELVTAAREANVNVSLYEYELSFRVRHKE